MAEKELIVDDDYCKEIGEYFIKKGKYIDACLESYLGIMNTISNQAIIEGSTHDAIQAYIALASKLKNQIKPISQAASQYAVNFAKTVKAKDKYTFK